MQQLDRLVYLTLAYSAYFAFPLTLEEIEQRLPVSDDVDYLFARKKLTVSKNIFSAKQIANSLKKLMRQGKIKSDGRYYFLSHAHLDARLAKQAYLVQKQTELMQLQEILSQIPLIKAAVLTGGSAVDNANRFDDLDVLIICRSQSLWLVRLWLVLLSKWKKKRPFKNNYAWCFNLFLDENDLLIKAKRHSLYEAYEILQMRFFYDPDNLRDRLLAINHGWLAKHLSYYQHSGRKLKIQNRACDRWQLSRKVLNQCLFFLQKAYRHARFGREDFALSLTQAFFNQGSFRLKLYSYLTAQLANLTFSKSDRF